MPRNQRYTDYYKLSITVTACQHVTKTVVILEHQSLMSKLEFYGIRRMYSFNRKSHNQFINNYNNMTSLCLLLQEKKQRESTEIVAEVQITISIRNHLM